jgi:hypothetical protein
MTALNWIFSRTTCTATCILSALLIVGCSSPTPTQPAADAGSQEAGIVDAGGQDAAVADASAQDAGYPHVYGTAKLNETCEVNASCGRDLRCECTDGACACKTGARGEGRSGVDTCKTGNECGSSICVEPASPPSVCSGYCKTPADCGPKQPRCLSVFGFSQNICSPPAPN